MDGPASPYRPSRKQGGTPSNSRPVTSQSARERQYGGFGDNTMQRPQTVWTNRSSTPTDASNWRTDEVMNTWYKSVQSRKKNEKVKTYKQAMKDAQWIIDRRARQMKEIRDRQKAEEAEAARNAYNASSNMMKQAAQSSGGRMSGKREESKDSEPSPKMQLHTNNWLPTGHTQHMLEWQDVPAVVADRGRTKDETVWIKPGVFVVKNVLTSGGNVFEK